MHEHKQRQDYKAVFIYEFDERFDERFCDVMS